MTVSLNWGRGGVRQLEAIGSHPSPCATNVDMRLANRFEWIMALSWIRPRNRHLLNAVADGAADGATRYEVPAKALRFFRRHAGLFSDNVGPLGRALQLYEVVRTKLFRVA